jgi:hypothetical protein
MQSIDSSASRFQGRDGGITASINLKLLEVEPQSQRRIVSRSQQRPDMSGKSGRFGLES